MNSTPPYVQIDEALTELGISVEDLKEFIGDLRQFIDNTLPELEAAIAKKDSNLVKEFAHAIKGALRNLRFNHAAESAFELENLGGGKGQGDMNAVYQELVKNLEASWLYLKAEGYLP